MLARDSTETEPQINADERRLNVSSFDNIDAEAFRNHREFHQNLWKDVNHFGINQKPLAIIKDKSHVINLRSSAFICGLKFDNIRQLYIISKIGHLTLLFVNLTSAFICVQLRLINFEKIKMKSNLFVGGISKWTILYNSEKDGAAYG